MTRQKLFLIAAAVLFVGWLGYLGYAVAVHRLAPPDVVSRSQLVEAEYVVVAEVTADGGNPADKCTVVLRLSDAGPGPETAITVANLPAARPPADGPFPGPGRYLLFLVPDSPDTYRVAGWPRGLGGSAVRPGNELKDADGRPFDPPRHIRSPVVYPWSDAVQKQMAKLGYRW